MGRRCGLELDWALVNNVANSSFLTTAEESLVYKVRSLNPLLGRDATRLGQLGLTLRFHHLPSSIQRLEEGVDD